MAKTSLNPALASFKGSIDGWTYRGDGDGGVIVYAHKSSKKPPSAKQLSRREKFTAAHWYAQHALEDPLTRLVYERLARQRKRPINTLLISNYLTPPTIERVDASEYTGAPGQRIRVVAFDEIEVAAVHVTIRTPQGAVIESGAGTSDHGVWTYRTTVPAPGPAWQIEVTALNRAQQPATVQLAHVASG